MPVAKKKKHPAPSEKPVANNNSATITQQVADLAWTGQHAKAIELASAALKSVGLSFRVEMDLLDFRATSYVALGDLDRAADDARTMRARVGKAKEPAFIAQALNLRALVEIRRGASREAMKTAAEALKAARASKVPLLEGISLHRLAEAQMRHGIGDAAAATAIEAANLFKRLGHPLGQGRAQWALSAARSSQGRVRDATEAAAEALALARNCGDRYGEGNALNMLTFSEHDVAKRLRTLQQSLAAFESIGYIERQGVITHNIGIVYNELGLVRRARRLLLQAAETYRKTGASQQLATTLWVLCFLEFDAGNRDQALAYGEESILLAESGKDARSKAYRPLNRGLFALEDRDAVTAIPLLAKAEEILRSKDAVALECVALTALIQAHLIAKDPAAALRCSERGTAIHRAHGLIEIEGMDAAELWWWHSRALAATGKVALARRAVDTAYGFVTAAIAGLSDEGLRRNFLNKRKIRREVIRAWLDYSAGGKEPSRRRPPHLAGASSLREPFERLADTGLRLNELRSANEIHDFLIDEATELSGAERVLLVLESPTGLQLAGSLVPRGENPETLLAKITPDLWAVRRTRAAILDYLPASARELDQRSRIVAPLIAQHKLLGFLYLDIDGAFGRFHDTDRDMMSMLASQAAVALDNAEWSQGLEQKVAERTEALQVSNAQLEQRAGELALINSIQQGMAAELDFRAIVDMVGDKLREVFKTGDVGIRWHDPASGLIHCIYEYQDGILHQLPPYKATESASWANATKTRQPLVMGTHNDIIAFGMRALTPRDNETQSSMHVPILGSDRVLGMIVMRSFEREHAFGDADARLLTTVGASMGVALENARLFDETQRLFKQSEQRATELAIINSVQEGLAAQLDFQAIIDLVGNKIREIFHAEDMSIALHDRASGKVAMPYYLEHGERFPVQTFQLGVGLTSRIISTRAPLVINRNYRQIVDQIGTNPIGDLNTDDPSKSYLGVPILKGDEAMGVIALYGNREDEFSESSVNLLTTLANSMSVALENARLFDETQRLLKETEQRNAQLAVINSIQQGMAGSLDFQGIVDLVGDKVRDVFHTDDIGIIWHDPNNDILQYLYAYEHGRRIAIEPRPPHPGGIWQSVLATRQPIVHNSVDSHAAVGIISIPGTDHSLCSLNVPIIGSDRVLGLIGIEDFKRENAFGESEVRLLSTVAASMGVALENARLFDETQRLLKETEQRAAELSVINSIQEGMAGSLDFQGIVDLVGDKLRSVLHTDDIGIIWHDRDDDILHYLYIYEHGVRIEIESMPPLPGGNWQSILETRQPIVYASLASQVASGRTALPGTDLAISSLGVPIIGSDRVLGLIGVDDFERENAFGESEVRLITTVAASMGVALENARLFDETQRLLKETEQRAAEMAVINSIQQGMAGSLDFQGIVDLVGDKLCAVLDVRDISITWFDPQARLVSPLYVQEHGKHLSFPPNKMRPGGPAERMIATRQVVVCGTVADQIAAGLTAAPGTDQSKSSVDVPIIGSDRVLGSVCIENHEREHAFGESEVRMLQTVAASMGVALENARLFDETQRLLKETEQRNAELAVINSIQQGMAAELNFQAIVDLVGDKLRNVLRTDDIGIMWLDQKNYTNIPLYVYEHGVRLEIPPTVFGPGERWTTILGQREPVVQNTLEELKAAGAMAMPGTDQCLSRILVPIVGNDRRLGSIDLENHERENAFGESEIRLLTTVAASMGVAMESARLFDETQRLLKETEQRNAELAIINSVQAALAAELNIQGIYDAVGDKIREIFAGRDVGIRVLDPKAGLVHYPYTYEAGQRIDVPSAPLGDRGIAVHVLRTRETVVINENMSVVAAGYGSVLLPGTALPKSQVFVPMVTGGQVRGILDLVDMEREHAFSESDVRLLQTLANSMSVALENARAVRRNATPAQGNGTARRGAGSHQQHPAGNGRFARLSGHCRPGRRQAARGVAHGGHRHPLVRRQIAPGPFSLRVRARRATGDSVRTTQDGILGVAYVAPRTARHQHDGGNGAPRYRSGHGYGQVERVRTDHRQRPGHWRYHGREPRPRIRVFGV